MAVTRSLALVTGASSGIGAALAERLARDGQDVVIVARRRERLEALAARLEAETGVAVEVLVADLTDPVQLAPVEERCDDPRLDLLVNNAGFGGYGPFAELEPHFAERLIDVHVTASVRLTRAALPGMLTRGRGAIVNVASLLALSGPLYTRMSGRATYVGAKAFVLAFTQALAIELEGTGVRAMAVLPGMVETEFVGRHREDNVPRPPCMMEAWEVAQAIVVGLELGEIVCVPGLEDIHAFDELRTAQHAALFGGSSGELASRYRRS